MAAMGRRSREIGFVVFVDGGEERVKVEDRAQVVRSE